ncbi:MAG: hypothetical protein ABI780_09265 [Ardenticatenales bacterium]
MRRSERVLSWSLVLYAAFYVAVESCAGGFGPSTELGCVVAMVPIAVPYTVAEMLSGLIWQSNSVVSGAGLSIVTRLLMYSAAALFIAEFVAQAMATAAVIDAALGHLRRPAPSEGDPSSPPS